ncbi:MAG TPA: hypothetical protein VFI45_19575 [Candidatus Acidoferrum sp.]|nr:hypothetical protein [Candidatus Acidoferrum sp.]
MRPFESVWSQEIWGRGFTVICVEAVVDGAAVEVAVIVTIC